LVLPSYASIGIAAPLLMLCFGQGVGLGGEWGGAVLLAIENAPPKRAGTVCFAIRCTNWFVTFWWNFHFNGYDEFKIFWIMVGGFIASSLLVVGFYIRLK
jgi:hypothetical protein